MTAQQCISHQWLVRRPLPEKKSDPQAPIIIEPKQPDELDVTKDNLRMFVERWSEHPNSPYLFDVTNHEITPCVSLNNCMERTASQQSLGGCSPSPCGSLNSSPDSVTESEEILYRNDTSTQVPEDDRRSFNSLSLERRASDSSCFVNKKADITLRVNLAEEIKKLSDRLFMLSTINTDLGNNNAENNNSEVTKEVNNITEKIPNGLCLTSSVKTGSTSNGGLNHTNSNSVAKTSLAKTKNGEKSTTSYKLESNTVKQSPSNGFQRQSSSSSSSTTVTTTSSTTNGNCDKSSKVNGYSNSISKSSSSSLFTRMSDESDNTMDSNIPWRRKFKINNSSRDVPMSPTEKKSMFGNEFNKRRDRIDNFVNNSNTNGESSSNTGRSRVFYKKTDENGEPKSNANNTKDLLLHLLDQWDESQCETNNNSNYNQSGRHKSVSMEWSEAEKVASKSMNTINTFFRKQSSISSSVKKKQEALANGYK